jgi:hypothetical protein
MKTFIYSYTSLRLKTVSVWREVFLLSARDEIEELTKRLKLQVLEEGEELGRFFLTYSLKLKACCMWQVALLLGMTSVGHAAWGSWPLEPYKSVVFTYFCSLTQHQWSSPTFVRLPSKCNNFSASWYWYIIHFMNNLYLHLKSKSKAIPVTNRRDLCFLRGTNIIYM